MSSIDVATARRFTAVGLVALAICTVFAQQLSSADPADQDTAKLVSTLIPKYHLSRKKVTDDTSSKLLDGFLKDLDPQKLYFLESDIKGFESHRLTLDNEITDGDIQFAYDVFELYRKRMTRQMKVVHGFIDQEHDFSKEEYIETDGDKVSWSKTTQELDNRWRLRVKYDLLQSKLDDETPEEGRKRLNKRYRNNQLAVEQYDAIDQMEIYLTALTQCYDPHSTYMSPQTWEDFEIQMRLSLDGIGAALRGDDGYTVVAQIVPGGAAATQGELKVGDKIVGVGQEEGEIVDIYEMKLSDVVRMIRGKRGTTVRLQVKSEDSTETKVLSMVRQKIELKESEVKGEVIDAKDRVGRAGKIGLLSLPSFYRDFAGAQGGGRNFKSAAADVKKVLADFARSGVDVVVVDLRNNGGGALTEAVEISGQFIDRGPVVQVKDPSGFIRELDDEESGVMYSGPLVVLCNRLSASASEIFAGVIKDYRRGIVIGDTTTHGKGTVQNLMDVSGRQPFRIVRSSDRGKLKLTIQQFYRVNGDSTQNRGVRSDIVLPSLIDHWDLGEASLENALPFDQIRPADYPEGRFVNANLVAAIQKNSETRTSSNEDFMKLNKAVERYLARKNRTRLPLKEEVVKAEREADEQLKKEQEKEEGEEEELVKPEDEEIFPESYYNDEVLNIALDYVAGLKGNLTVAK